MIKKLCLGVLACLIWFTNTWSQDLRLGSPFKEHMVLQQNMPVKVWGETKPLSYVCVRIGNDSVRVESDNAGNWLSNLPKQKAGGPYIFEVKTKQETLTFTDVLVGEVWICSGQSNMFMGYNGIPNIKALESSATNIRTLKVSNTVAFTEQKYMDAKWELANPQSAIAFSFAYNLQKEANVPVGIILTSWGSSSIEGWMPRDMTKQLPHFKAIMDNFDADIKKKERIEKILATPGTRKRNDDIFIRIQPNIIYNAMMNPIAPYTCRGLVWYQGEANSKTMDNMLQYGTTLPLWIKRMRDEFQNDQLHFLGVMLPGFGGYLNKQVNQDSIMNSPSSFSWAWIRESQLKALALNNTNIANTIDLGEARNIHPTDKLPVGERLALLAQHYTLGENVIADGPSFKTCSVKRRKICLHFEHAKGLKTIDGKAPKAFWVSDHSGVWHKANAKIHKDKISVRSKTLKHPLYVRYAFAAKPNVNLVNAAGLPAQPFRTDTFAPPEKEK